MANNITATLKLNIGHGVVGTFYRRDDNSIIIHIADNMEAAHGEGTTDHAEKIPFYMMGAKANTEYTFSIPLPARQ